MADKNKEAEQSQVERKLDMMVAILLAQSGLTREEIADILDVSYKTIERMFKGKFNRIQFDPNLAKRRGPKSNRIKDKPIAELPEQKEDTHA